MCPCLSHVRYLTIPHICLSLLFVSLTMLQETICMSLWIHEVTNLVHGKTFLQTAFNTTTSQLQKELTQEVIAANSAQIQHPARSELQMLTLTLSLINESFYFCLQPNGQIEYSAKTWFENMFSSIVSNALMKLFSSIQSGTSSHQVRGHDRAPVYATDAPATADH